MLCFSPSPSPALEGLWNELWTCCLGACWVLDWGSRMEDVAPALDGLRPRVRLGPRKGPAATAQPVLERGPGQGEW